MDKIVSFTKKLKEKRRKDDGSYRLRSEVIRRTVQCSSCRHSCAMCGVRLDATDGCCPGHSLNQALNLCEPCRAEYLDFIKRSKKGDVSGILWHNEEWMRLWSAWVEYQKALKAFRNSREFQQLIQEPE